LLGLCDDEGSGKMELQPCFLSVLMERKERELEGRTGVPMVEEREEMGASFCCVCAEREGSERDREEVHLFCRGRAEDAWLFS